MDRSLANPDPHHGSYRLILAMVGVAVPVAGLLAWSSPMLYDRMDVRIGFSAACAVGVFGSARSPAMHAWLREITAGILLLLFAWFAWVATHHRMSPDDVVGLLPIALAASLLVRTTAEQVGVASFTLGALGLAYAAIAEPAFPPGIVILIFGVLTLGGGAMSISRSRLERALGEMNAQLERRVAERTASLSEREAEARRANEAKSLFLANMSHELRTPLTAILGYTEIVREDLEDREPDARDDLERVTRAAQHLLGLIDDLLDLARIEAGQLTLADDRVDVAGAVDAAVQLVASAARARGNTIEVDSPPGLFARGDPARVRQVLLNLLSNAAKFTERGRIDVRARGVDGRVRIEVADTGVGMTPEVLARAFDRFSLGDASSTRAHGGAGLGLAIAVELVQRMGGEIAAESVPGAGSRFTVSLPGA